MFIGAVTFTGSVVAFGKLAGKVDGKARKLPGGHGLNAGAALALAGPAGLLYVNGAASGRWWLMTLLAFFIGYHLIMGIGGADMPVVVSMLNSLLGLGGGGDRLHPRQRPADRHRRPGRLLGRDPELHHVQGDEPQLHQRDPGRVRRPPPAPMMAIAGEQIAIDADGVATALEEADSIVIVPGYGMAVAQAQQSVSELTRRCGPRARRCALPSTRWRAACRGT